ncbi:MAG: hypothetical protein R2880_13545 [Deinococcales bacterium]
MQSLALIRKGRNDSSFIDPANPQAGEIVWEGRWRTLSPTYDLAITWENYPKAFTTISFLRMLGYTLSMPSSPPLLPACRLLLAYGFCTFSIPFKNVLFIVLISTIISPQVTLVPTYAFFIASAGWARGCL